MDRQSHNEYLSCVQVFPPSEDQGQRSQLNEATESTPILGDESKTVPKEVAGLPEVPTDEVEQALDSAPAGDHPSLAVPALRPADTTTAEASEGLKRVSRALKLKLAVVVVVTIPFFLFYSSLWDEWLPKAVPDTGAELQSPVQEPAQAVLDVVEGVVTDRGSGHAISGAQVYYAGELAMTDGEGRFRFHREPENNRVQVKAVGYRQFHATVSASSMKLELERLDVHAIYVNRQSISSPERRKNVLSLIRQTGSNAIVMTIKDTRGELSIPVDHPFAQAIRAFRDQGKNRLQSEALRDFKSKSIYTIALVATFKDGLLARKKPATALRSLASNRVILGTAGIAWTDPSATGVQEYNLEVARAAARAGFDEVMFDFIRYPATSLSLEGATAPERKRRLKTIVGFLREAAGSLAQHNVYVSATVFGSV